MNNIAEWLFDEYSTKVIEICEKLCKDDFEDIIEVICTKGIESLNKIQMTCIVLLKKIANQLIDMKQDIAIQKACIFIEHVGKQLSKNNKQLIFAIQKYGKDSQLPIRDKFKIMDLTDLVEKKRNIDLSQDDIIVASKVPKHSSIEEAETGATKNENSFILEKISSRTPLSAKSALETEPSKVRPSLQMIAISP
ncbi:hypothetical protein QYM36_008217 [Artemia franciscana]|uniref:Uncharacterized protein n=1 Tax=Artemia franciscana TaxID=6661 RepID=A0AA88IIP5_ARTSF|nr:hypothetical protein QYM36_008217 [Artemia franciscana]